MNAKTVIDQDPLQPVNVATASESRTRRNRIENGACVDDETIGQLFLAYIDHFEQVAAEYADRCAVSCASQFLTYRELNQHTNRLA